MDIPILSGLVVIAGAFMAVLAIYTFIPEGRKAIGVRRASAGGGGTKPPQL